MALLACIHKITKSLKKLVNKALSRDPHKKPEKKTNQNCYSEIEENKTNEAIEARLLYLIESPPSAHLTTLKGSHLSIVEEDLQFATFWIEEDNALNLYREAFLSLPPPLPPRRTAAVA